MHSTEWMLPHNTHSKHQQFRVVLIIICFRKRLISPVKAHYSMYSSIRYVYSGLIILLLILILPKQDLQAQTNYVSFAVAAGVTDVVPHQLVRTNDDRLYIVAVKAQYSTRVAVY